MNASPGRWDGSVGGAHATMVEANQEVTVTSNSADNSTPVPRQRPRVSVEELARRKGVRPVQSLDE
ncbi:MAG TPA: hypothetical protein VH141_28000, partial [Pseudonocardia sp.]|nr:hypothetical protein [Pseudonocardia sp.]